MRAAIIFLAIENMFVQSTQHNWEYTIVIQYHIVQFWLKFSDEQHPKEICLHCFSTDKKDEKMPNDIKAFSKAQLLKEHAGGERRNCTIKLRV